MEETVFYKGKDISYGKYLFNKCLPEDYPLVEDVVDKSKLKTILNDIVLKYSPNDVMTVLNNIKNLGFEVTTKYGFTLGIDDLYSKELMDIMESYEDKGVIENTKFFNSDEVMDIMKKLPIGEFVESGARGSWDQVRQLVLARGHVADANNKIRNNLIKSSYVKGLNPKEFFESCWGARKGMMDTALSTGASGYLTRQMVYSTSHVELDDDLEDCGTEDCIEVDFSFFNKDGSLDVKKSEKYAKIYLWRNFVDDNGNIKIVTSKNYKDLVGKTVRFRSPIYCKSKKICKTCYGNLHKILHSNQIGLTAVHAVSERTTQLILRTFHTSFHEDTEILDINNNKIRIKDVYNKIKNGEPLYTFSCSPEGKIEVSKIVDAYKDHYTNKKIRITLDNKESFEVTHNHEIMMRDGSYKMSQDLVIGDSLMPIKIHENGDSYRRIKQNDSELNKEWNEIKIYKLASKHKDCKNLCENTEESKIHVHHLDKNVKNDYPTNLNIIPYQEHYDIHRDNIISAVIESNTKRMQDPEYKQQQIDKRVETWKDEELRKSTGEAVSEWYDEHPGEGARVINECRRTCIKNVIEKLLSLKLRKKASDYNYIRKRYFSDNGLRYPTFSYAFENHKDLMEGFFDDLDYENKKTKNILAVEDRMDKILNYMENNGLDMTYGEFDRVNNIIYSNANGRIHREKTLKVSPGYLSFLKDEGGTHMLDRRKVWRSKTYEYGKGREQLQAESRMYKIVEKMKEKNLEMTCYNFDKTSEELYPNPKARRSRESMLKNSPNFLDEILLDNHYVTNVEFIDLPKTEGFYDITVDSVYSNFPLAAGIFVHNSGVVSDVNEKEENTDIIHGINIINKLFHCPDTIDGIENAEDLLKVIYNIFESHGAVHMVHFEIIIMSMMWHGSKQWRLSKNRNNIKNEWVSILKIPSKVSWLIGVAFANVKNRLIDGLVDSSNDDVTALSSLFRL